MEYRVGWSTEKEIELRQQVRRNGVSFPECIIAIENGDILGDLSHPTRPGQRILILAIEFYAYVVPYVVESDGTFFLKTVFPSRKFTAKYFDRGSQDDE